MWSWLAEVGETTSNTQSGTPRMPRRVTLRRFANHQDMRLHQPVSTSIVRGTGPAQQYVHRCHQDPTRTTFQGPAELMANF